MRNLESLEQQTLITWTRTLAYKYPALYRLHSIPNGAFSYKHGSRLKCEGVLAGVSDLFLAYPAHGKHGLYLELKAGKGKATPEQMWWITESNRLGYEAYVCVGWITAAQRIGAYLDISEKDIPR